MYIVLERGNVVRKFRCFWGMVLLIIIAIVPCEIVYADDNVDGTIVVGQEQSFVITEDIEDVKILYFTPLVSGSYKMKISATGDASLSLSSNGYVLKSVNFWLEDSNESFLSYELIAGTTYKYKIGSYADYNIGVSCVLMLDLESVLPWDEEFGYFVLAEGASKEILLKDTFGVSSMQWFSSDSNIAFVDNKGNVTGRSPGNVKISVVFVDIYNVSSSYSVQFIITNPHTENGDVSINTYSENGEEKDKNGYYTCSGDNCFTIEGLDVESEIKVVSHSKNLKVEVSDRMYQGTLDVYLSPKKKGKYLLTVIADGKEFAVNVIVRKLYFEKHKRSIGDEFEKRWHKYSNSIIVLTKGESTRLSLKGALSTDDIKYTSSDTNVVTVSKSGKIKAMGNGQATVTATVGTDEISYDISVTNKQSLKALLYASEHYGDTYSQEKRMQEGYYDCSSYVWRAYASSKLYLGPSKNWAPTAADMAKWCAKRHMVIMEGAIDTKRLLPGDLIFITDSGNSRYKGIDHVDIFLGHGISMTVNGKYDFEPHFGYLIDDKSNYYVVRPTGTKTTGLIVKKSGNSLKLTWTQQWGANGYQIYRADSKNGVYKKIGTAKKGKLMFVDKTAKKGKTYYYKVRAYWKSDKTYYGTYSSVAKKKR